MAFVILSPQRESSVPPPLWKDGKLRVKAYDGSIYTLYKSTWDLKILREERAHLQYNFHKIVETLETPDEVRKSNRPNSTCFIAYKEFNSYFVRPNITAPNPPGLKTFAVIADSKSKIVKTFYPCRVSKKGERLWPK